MARSADSACDGGVSQATLRAQLAVTPPPEANCVVAETGADATEVTQHLKRGTDTDDSECGECHTQLSYDAADDTYLRTAVGPDCTCLVFQQHDCIPEVIGVDGGALIVVLTVPAREELSAIVSDLKTTGTSVTLEWLVDGTDDARTAELDVSTVTEKQQEAMALAEEMGYYESPRKAGLSEIADELGVTESAVSQRLNAAETKLVHAFLDDHR